MTFKQTLSDWQAQGLVDKPWFNGLWFQLTWFACVLGRDPWLPAIALMFTLHLLLVPSVVDELKRIAPVAGLGILADSVLTAAGVFDFGDAFIPAWLIALWFAFSTTLHRALAVFGRRLWIAALIGAVAVPLNYGAGAKMGAVDLPLGSAATAITLVTVWFFLLPSLYWLAKGITRKQANDRL